jgi:WD40-like Beta Propeller Repeat
VAFRHSSWEQRARRLRRRRQRRVAAAAVTLAGGQMAWMVAHDARPAAALTANRTFSIHSVCTALTNSCLPPQSTRAPGGVSDVAVSDDGRFVAFVTSEALLPSDTDPQVSQPQFRRDVYVSTPEGLVLVTDDDHPGGGNNQFWTVGTDVDISGDGRWVTWTMLDDQATINFFPAAVPVATGGADADFDEDVFVAEIDTVQDFVLGPAGPPLLASVNADEANLLRQSFQPSISRDGRFIAFTHFGTTQPTPSDVVLHDRDVDGNGVFDEAGAGQTSTVINPGAVAPFSQRGADQPEVAPDGGFVAFRAFELSVPSSTGLVRVWRQSDNTTFEATTSEFTFDSGGNPTLLGTIASWPTISADGSVVAYDFEIVDDNVQSDPQIPFGRHQTVVVDVDPGADPNGPFILSADDDPATTNVFEETPYIVSQDPTDADPNTRVSDSTTQSFPSISTDGRYVVYESNADNVAGHLGSGNSQIYAVDRLQPAAADRVPVLVTANGDVPADDGSDRPDVAGLGAFVAFTSTAGNLASFPTITGDPNAFTMRWLVGVEASGGPLVFPDTAVGATSPTQPITFDTDDFGPWNGQSLDLLDGYIDPNLHDYSVVGGCASPTISFHANDPCVVQVTFAPMQIGNRVGELCLQLFGGEGCSATATVGGQALVPDGVGPLVRESQVAAGDSAEDPALSANGRYIAFETDASFDPSDENDLTDIYVRDRLRGTTTLISFGDGLQGEGDPSRNPAISGDGQFITFESDANKAPEPGGVGDGLASDIFRVDRGVPNGVGDFDPALASMSLVSVGVGGAVIRDEAQDATMSGDGTQIAFRVFGGEGGCEGADQVSPDICIRDLGGAAPTTRELSAVLPATVSDTDQPDISADGEHLAFVGDTELGPGEFGPVFSTIVYVYDRDVDADGVLDEPNDPTPGQTRVVQVTTSEFTPLGDPSGEPADLRGFALEGTASFDPSISGDGTTVAYAFEQFYDFTSEDLPLDLRLTPLPRDEPQIIVADRDPLTGAPLLSEVVSVAGPGDTNK